MEPLASFKLETEAQKKAYLHPERIRILGFLTHQQRTVSQVAKEMGVHAANLTHHFKKLEAAGLILLVEKRDSGRVLEKYYRAVALLYDVATEPNSYAQAGSFVLSFLKNDLEIALRVAEHDAHAKLIGLLHNAKINPTSFDLFARRLEELMAEFAKLESSEGASYTLNVSLYPTSRDYSSIGQLEIR